MRTDGPDDDVLWRAVVATLRDVVVPALPPGHELDTAVQLQGLAAYAATRPPDPAADRARALAEALGRPGLGLPDALSAASAVLVAGLDRPDPVAARVRAVLLAQLDEDVRVAAPLLAAFAGHRAEDVPLADRQVPDGERAALTRWFAAALGGDVRLERSVVMTGGHSRRMLRVDLTGPAGPGSFVVRVEQGGVFGTEGAVEAGAMRALAAAGVPVAPVRWVEPDPAPLGHPFFVMDLVPGSSAVDDRALQAFLAALARVHAVDPAVASDALGPPPPPEQAVLAQVQRWEDVYRGAAPLPVPLLDEAAAWLRRHLRPTGPVALVHGDPGPGNFLHVDGVVTALTDWEFVHHGDAAEDWSYLATVRSRRLRTAPEWYAELERRVGVRHDAATWHAWEAFNQFKGACANLTAGALFTRGTATTPSLLAIGTAVHARFLRRLADLVAP